MKTVLGSATVVLLTSALATGGVIFGMGGVLSAGDEAASATVIAGETTPARTLIENTLGSLPELGATGPTRWAAGEPFPYNCNTPAFAPALSGAAPVTVDDVQVTVTVTAYEAGIGASVYPQLTGSVSTCTTTGDGVTAVAAGFGTESTAVTVVRVGGVRATSIARSGDIIWYVNSTNPDATARVSAHVAERIDTLAAETCVEVSSVAGDALRNLILGEEYVPLAQESEVVIESPGLPTVAKGSLERIPIDIDLPVVEPVIAEQVPTWPVWPEMPEPVTAPTITKPSSEPVLTAAYTELLEDVAGPGCGWEFAGTATPMLDADAIEKENRSARTAVTEDLEKDAADWKKSVLAFWKEWPAYQESLTAYMEYRGEVELVNNAWRAISAEWANYNAAVTAYSNERTAYAAKLAAIAKAKTDYAAALAACKAPPPAPDPTPSPEPTPGEPEPEAPAVKVASVKTSAVNCDATVPVPRLLTEPAPIEPTGAAPTPPKDPRPLTQKVKDRAGARTG